MSVAAQAGPPEPPGGTPRWRVSAIRYATLQSRRSTVFLDGATHDDGPQQLDYFIWLLQSPGRTIVVDTGCRQDIAERRGRTYLRAPHATLAALGIDPLAVTDVVITHLHYDHAGNLDHYPAARFHLQDREMAFATGRMMCAGPLFTGALEQEDVVNMVRTVFAQRVVFADGDAEIAPGVRVFRVGGHTPGLQAVQVWSARGWLVLASDAAHFYENIASRRPFHIVADVAEMTAGWARVQRMASGTDHVIPGHDPLVMQQYPALRPGLDGVVSLDAPPLFSALAAAGAPAMSGLQV